MAQDLDQNVTPHKLIDIESIDAKALLGLEESGPAISSDQPFRKWLYDWTLNPNIPGNFQKSLDSWIGILIVVNLFALVLEHVPALFVPYERLFHYFDIFSVTVFVIEYLLRFYLAPEDEEFQRKAMPRVAYIFSPFAIIDFLAVAPFFLQAFIPIDLRALRFLRLLRILKLFRIVIPAIKEFAELNRERTFRQKIHAMVFESPYGGKFQGIFETFIGIWVIISVFAVVLESIHSVSYLINLEFVILDTIAVAIFTIEYLMRLYSCVEEPRFRHGFLGRFKQARSAATFIDLLAILPFFLEVLLGSILDLRFLRTFRLARLLKLTRYNDSTKILTTVIAREWPVISASAFIMILMVIMTASLGYVFEHEAQPEKFDNIPNSVYWAVITLASVGYGDISPVTAVGRFMTVVMALLGIGIFAIPAALLASAFGDQLHKEREMLKNNLRQMMKDGHLDETEIETLRSEAKRLHITIEELNTLLENVHIERINNQNNSKIPLHVIAERPAQAIEHYKNLLGQIHQLALLTDAAKFEAEARESDRLTATELALWQQILARKNSS
ncbi:MAG: ion transporter [Limnohabitans sp.]|nr:ion transporter [Limnohabitans sp.]